MTKAPMQRIDNILKNETYLFLMGKIRERELARIFCCHGLDHCLDVARIAYMLDMDEGAGIDRELIYAAALLHDVGRADPDNTGMEHHILSVRYAGDILRQCGFEEVRQVVGKCTKIIKWECTIHNENKDETEIICDAIGSHNTDGADRHGLAYFLYKADKLSRNCFNCAAADECYWPDSERNKGIIY